MMTSKIDDIDHTQMVVKVAVPRLERSRVAHQGVGGKRRLRDASDDERSGAAGLAGAARYVYCEKYIVSHEACENYTEL